MPGAVSITGNMKMGSVNLAAGHFLLLYLAF